MSNEEIAKEIMGKINSIKEAEWNNEHERIDAYFRNRVDKETLETITYIARMSFHKGFTRGAMALMPVFDEQRIKEHAVE